MSESVGQSPEIRGRIVICGSAEAASWARLSEEINERCQRLGLKVNFTGLMMSSASQLEPGECLVSAEDFSDYATYTNSPKKGIGTIAWRALCRAKLNGKDSELASGGLKFHSGPLGFIVRNGVPNESFGRLDLLSLHKTFTEIGGYHERNTRDFRQFFSGPRMNAGIVLREFVGSFIEDTAVQSLADRPSGS